MKHVLCVHLHQLPIDRLRRRIPRGQPELRDKPFVLVQTTGNRHIVVHATSDELPDIYPGMSLAEAKGRHMGLLHFPVAPAEDLRMLEAVGRWLMKFSPNVCIVPPSSILIDSTGIERLFGGIHNFRNRVTNAIQSLRFSVGIAIAPTPGAAWAMAAFGKNGDPITQDNLLAALSPLPPQALRLEPPTVELLASLGIRTIGELMRLERKSLVVRFGAQILQRIDQMMGTAPEPLVFLEHHIPIHAVIDFDGTIESLEVIHLAVRQLVDRIVEILSIRGLGARELCLSFQCPYSPSVEKSVQLMRPSRNAKAISNLLYCALETVALDDGVTGVQLDAVITQRLGDEQSQLIDGEDQQSAAELEHLVERLKARLDDSVHWVELVESHIPERAFRSRDEAVATKPSSYHEKIGEFRPLSLFPRPRPIKVIVNPSECLDGQPVSFTDYGAVHRLHHVRGPERLTGQWWTGQRKTRDYFDVLDAEGNRYWLFRIPETKRWFIHGKFE